MVQKNGRSLRRSQRRSERREPTPVTEHSTAGGVDRQEPTSGSEERSCSWCGQEIAGRRRNGFCSDPCRLRARRAAKQERLEAGLASIEGRVRAVRGRGWRSELDSLQADLLGGVEREERDDSDGLTEIPAHRGSTCGARQGGLSYRKPPSFVRLASDGFVATRSGIGSCGGSDGRTWTRG